MAGARQQQASTDNSGDQQATEREMKISLGSGWILFFPFEMYMACSVPEERKYDFPCSKRTHAFPFHGNGELQNSYGKPSIQTGPYSAETMVISMNINYISTQVICWCVASNLMRRERKKSKKPDLTKKLSLHGYR